MMSPRPPGPMILEATGSLRRIDRYRSGATG